MRNGELCDSPEALTALNRDWFCLSFDGTALSPALEAERGAPGLYDLTRAQCPYLFSTQPVFVTQSHLQRMRTVIDAVDTVVHSHAWCEQLLRSAPAIVRRDPRGANVVFTGYDFHIGADSLGLIEINTIAEALTSLEVPQAVQRVLLAGIPHTEVVDPGQADRLWAAHKRLFFKPAPVGGFAPVNSCLSGNSVARG